MKCSACERRRQHARGGRRKAEMGCKAYRRISKAENRMAKLSKKYEGENLKKWRRISKCLRRLCRSGRRLCEDGSRRYLRLWNQLETAGTLPPIPPKTAAVGWNTKKLIISQYRYGATAFFRIQWNSATARPATWSRRNACWSDYGWRENNRLKRSLLQRREEESGYWLQSLKPTITICGAADWWLLANTLAEESVESITEEKREEESYNI